MPILKDAPVDQIVRLLDLFPVSLIRAEWPDVKEKAKDPLCEAIAAKKDREKVGSFIEGHFSCTKQHVYIFDRTPGKIALLKTILDGEVIRQAGNNAIYLSKIVKGVYLQKPLEHRTITFLRPVKIEATPTHLVVRFVVLEKKVTAYFKGTAYPAERGIEESDILDSIRTSIQDVSLTKCDLHKGVRELWSHSRKFMDAARTRYKMSNFSGTVRMDEGKGMRETEPDMYNNLSNAPLSEMLFQLAENKHITTVSLLSIDPAQGTLSFHRYSEAIGDTDRVIREILQNN